MTSLLTEWLSFACLDPFCYLFWHFQTMLHILTVMLNMSGLLNDSFNEYLAHEIQRARQAASREVLSIIHQFNLICLFMRGSS